MCLIVNRMCLIVNAENKATFAMCFIVSIMSL